MPSLSFTPPLADGGLPSLGAQRPWARNVSHWKPLPVRTVIATRLSSVYQSPCLSTDSDSIAQTFLLWHDSIRPLSLPVPTLPDQRALRWIVSGTGAVPTDNVTWLLAKVSWWVRMYSLTW